MIQLEEKAAEAIACVQKAETIMAELGHTKYSLSGMCSAAMRHDLEKEVCELLGELANAVKQRDTLAEALELFLSRVRYTSIFMNGNPKGGTFDYHSHGFDAEVELAHKALAAVKGGSHE